MSTKPDSSSDACRSGLEPDRHDALHPELDAWRANVGAPVALDVAAEAPARMTGVDVLSWNVAIGAGRLDRMLERLRERSIGESIERPLIILLQEAFRSSDALPAWSGTRHHGGRGGVRSERQDIVSVAAAHGMSVRYSPSMRNGADPSDRGNAILSNVRLTDARAFLLPYVRQRRVAVAARVAGHPDLTFVSAHLDTHGQPRTREGARRFGGGRALQARALAQALTSIDGSAIVGADLNTFLGMSDPAVRELVAAGMHPARRVGNWRYTFRRLRLLLDHVLYHSPDGRIAHAEVTRIDDVAGRSDVFGSDHHPLLARIELRDT